MLDMQSPAGPICAPHEPLAEALGTHLRDGLALAVEWLARLPPFYIVYSTK